MLRTPRRSATSVAWFWALSLPLWPAAATAQSPAESTRDPAVAPTSLTAPSQPVRSGSRGGHKSSQGETTSGWWLGPAGIAAAFAVVGGASLASKRFGLNLNLGLTRETGPVAVVGQTRLSPKHSVYLVRVGGRVLILGAGQGGSPTTLGEVTDPSELARLIPQRPARPSASTPAVKVAGLARPTGFDQRIGDDE